MQGRENTSGDLMALQYVHSLNARLMHALILIGCSACSIRQAVHTAAKQVVSWKPSVSSLPSKVSDSFSSQNSWALIEQSVRNYHSTYYVPHNLTLIVGGKLSSGTSSLLQVVQDKVEPTLIEHGQNKGARPAGWKRPFVETPSANRQPIAKDVSKVVEFPEKDESMGELVLSFAGPPHTHFLERKVSGYVISDISVQLMIFDQALDVLSTYLTGSAVAPLNKEYIEVESPLW